MGPRNRYLRPFTSSHSSHRDASYVCNLKEPDHCVRASCSFVSFTTRPPKVKGFPGMVRQREDRADGPDRDGFHPAEIGKGTKFGEPFKTTSRAHCWRSRERSQERTDPTTSARLQSLDPTVVRPAAGNVLHVPQGRGLKRRHRLCPCMGNSE